MRTRPPETARPGRSEPHHRCILERLPDKEGLVGYRTRAFVIYSDGVLRTGAAIWLNIEEVGEGPHCQPDRRRSGAGHARMRWKEYRQRARLP